MLLNKIFWSKKAHRVFTVLFLISLLAYGNILNVSIADTSTNSDIVGAGLGFLVAFYYDALYVGYFIVRFFWRIFNKPDINQYEEDKKKMPRNEFMRKYGVYRY